MLEWLQKNRLYLLRTSLEIPISFVLFGPTGRESETRNWAKPAIIQITSFKCRRWYGRCVCWEISLKDTRKSGMGRDTGKDICQGKQKGWARFLFAVPEVSTLKASTWCNSWPLQLWDRTNTVSTPQEPLCLLVFDFPERNPRRIGPLTTLFFEMCFSLQAGKTLQCPCC